MLLVTGTKTNCIYNSVSIIKSGFQLCPTSAYCSYIVWLDGDTWARLCFFCSMCDKIQRSGKLINESNGMVRFQCNTTNTHGVQICFGSTRMRAVALWRKDMRHAFVLVDGSETFVAHIRAWLGRASFPSEVVRCTGLSGLRPSVTINSLPQDSCFWLGAV